MANARIGSPGLTAEIAARGAELVRLTTGDGRELLWNGDPRWWSGRSPLLFPIVGMVPGDRILVDGRHYEMPKHGIARTADFALLEADRSGCVFELRSSAETLQRYPFAFALQVAYRISDRTLTMTATVRNDGATAMPMSFGFHPALLWPLPDDPRRDAYEICFESEEPAPVRRLADGLLTQTREPSPVEGRSLHLRDSLFENDAIIFDAPRSRSLTYGPRAAPALRVRFPDMPQLGVWTKPGAPYICIEPWRGYAAPQGFAGEFRDKPGSVSVPPGGSQAHAMSIELIAP